MDRAALAAFLRTRREALQPEDVGLTPSPRRRTPGLRREEVAVLAGMSTDYYARLEQQRGPQPSLSVLLTVARTLRLSLDERDHLIRLAGHLPAPRSHRTDHVAPALLRVLDRLDDTPAVVISDLGETLAQNRGGVALLGDQMQHEGPRRSAFFRWFTDPAERARYPERDHAHQTTMQTANLRAAISSGGEDERSRAIVEGLLEHSAEFRRAWAEQQVAYRHESRKTLVHPELGEVEVDCQKLRSENLAQALLVFTATPGSPSAEKLRLLAVLGPERFAPA
ncbi:XRE family transcriptional regulator, partial [Nocardioides mangrovicus]